MWIMNGRYVKKANKINSALEPHMQVDLYLISEIFFCASLFFLLSRPCPRMLRSFWTKLFFFREKCVIRIQLHSQITKKKFGCVYIFLDETNFFCLIDDSKAQFVNDVKIQSLARAVFFCLFFGCKCAFHSRNKNVVSGDEKQFLFVSESQGSLVILLLYLPHVHSISYSYEEKKCQQLQLHTRIT